MGPSRPLYSISLKMYFLKSTPFLPLLICSKPMLFAQAFFFVPLRTRRRSHRSSSKHQTNVLSTPTSLHSLTVPRGIVTKALSPLLSFQSAYLSPLNVTFNVLFTVMSEFPSPTRSQISVCRKKNHAFACYICVFHFCMFLWELKFI